MLIYIYWLQIGLVIKFVPVRVIDLFRSVLYYAYSPMDVLKRYIGDGLAMVADRLTSQTDAGPTDNIENKYRDNDGIDSKERLSMPLYIHRMRAPNRSFLGRSRALHLHRLHL